MGLLDAFFSSKNEQRTQAPTGFQTLPGFAQQGLEEAVGSARGFLQDPSIFAPTGLTPEQQQAISLLASGAQPLTDERFRAGISMFQDPYLEATLTPALEDLQRIGRGAFGDIGAQASAAGAFGSSRQALREAELGRNLAKEAARISAGVRSQGFESATDRFLSELGRQRQGAEKLFDVGEAIRTLQQQQRQAPVQATSFLSSLIQGLPTGGGPVETTLRAKRSPADILGSLAGTAGGLLGLR